MGKKLLAKAGLIGLPEVPAAVPAGAAPAAQAAEPVRAKTAPGTMLGFMTAQSAAIQEADALRNRLASFEGASPARRVDPKLIAPSRWANRHASSFEEEAFEQLKADIGSAGGNVQAIKIRPISAHTAPPVGPSNPPAPTPQFEIVFGHRRHRACLELGLPVLAVIEDLSEQQLFVEMERENRARKDLSAWEQGAMYARALDQGLYPSNRQLAMAIGRDLGDVGKALALARLPDAVVAAFATPLDLQFRWAKLLSDAQQKDPEGLIARAKSIRQAGGNLNAKQVLDRLIEGLAAEGVGQSNPLAATVIERQGKQAATVTFDKKGRAVVRIDVPSDEARRRKLLKLIQGFVDS